MPQFLCFCFQLVSPNFSSIILAVYIEYFFIEFVRCGKYELMRLLMFEFHNFSNALSFDLSTSALISHELFWIHSICFHNLLLNPFYLVFICLTDLLNCPTFFSVLQFLCCVMQSYFSYGISMILNQLHTIDLF